MFLSKLHATLERYSPHIPNFHTTLDYHLSHSELCPTLLQTFRLTDKDCYKAETYRHKKRIDPVRINPNMRLLEPDISKLSILLICVLRVFIPQLSILAPADTLAR